MPEKANKIDVIIARNKNRPKLVLLAAVEHSRRNRTRWPGILDPLTLYICWQLQSKYMVSHPFKFYQSGCLPIYIAHLVLLFFFGLPVVYLSVILGQFTSSTGPSTFNFVPLIRIIGWITAVERLAFYTENVASTSRWLDYFFMTLQPSPPWSSCPKKSMDENCTKAVNNVASRTSHANPNWTWTDEMSWPAFAFMDNYAVERKYQLGALIILFFFAIFLLSMAIDETKVAVIQVTMLVFCILAVVVMVLVFTTLPTPDSLIEGFSFLAKYELPSTDKLVNVMDDFILFLGFSLGTVPTISSYNNFHYKPIYVTFTIAVAEIVMTLFGMLLTFTLAGYVFQVTKYNFKEGIAVESWYFFCGLLPQVLFDAHPQWRPLLSCIYFFFFVSDLLMVFLASVGLIESFVGSRDAISTSRKKNVVTIACILLAACIATVMVSVVGQMRVYLRYILHTVILLTIIVVCLVTTFIYRWKNISKDLQMMTGQDIPKGVILSCTIQPFVYLFIANYRITSYISEDALHPKILMKERISITLIHIVFLLYTVTRIIKSVLVTDMGSRVLNLREKFRRLCSPSLDYGPRYLENWIHDDRYRKKLEDQLRRLAAKKKKKD